jgi:hypothetical protein
MRKANNPVRIGNKADIEEFARRARNADTKEQVVGLFAEIILRHARRHWIDEFWDIYDGPKSSEQLS